jgi:hypothetical protein
MGVNDPTYEVVNCGSRSATLANGGFPDPN